MVDTFDKILTLILTIIIELVIYWKISHAFENWRKTTSHKEEDFHSKTIVGMIMIALIFLISFSAMIIDMLITNEIIELNIIFVMVVLLIGYLGTLKILSNSLQIKFSSEKLDSKKYKERKSQHQKKNSK